MAATMLGAYLPGGRRVELRDVPVPEPGPVQVIVEIRASTICGSDLRAIYREHTGTGAEAYRDVIAGHEPAGRVGPRRPRAGRLRGRHRYGLPADHRRRSCGAVSHRLVRGV